jgi:murein DD-endopeptidase MepM/ murein hydrolase activator NlpD
MAGWLRRLGRLSIRRRSLAEFFPDREFHYRTNGRIRYFVLSSRAQFGLCAIFAAAVSWSIFATFYFVSFDGVLQEKNRELAMARKSERELMGEVLRFNSRFRELTENIAKSRAELLRMAGNADWPKNGVGDNLTPAERQKLAESMAAFKALSQSWQELNNKSARLETELKALAGEVEVSLGEQTKLRMDRDRLAAQLREMGEQLAASRATNDKLIAEVEQGKLYKKERDAFSARIRTLDDEVAALRGVNTRMRQRAEAKAEEERVLRRERDALAGRVRALEDELTAMRASQERLVENLFDRSKKGVAELERVVAMTGLDIDRMIGTNKGKGGPNTSEAKYTDDENLNERVADLRRRLERWQTLQSAVKSLPLVAPLKEYRITSSYGGRRDPFTGRWSAHNGIDMTQPAGTPIMATGPGTVVLTGWHGGYGWMVEIDHGMGVRTRYAHMQSITVEKGDKVEPGTKVGLVGSAGRSSGPHLHYEILIDGKAVDPTNFLTAGRYVLKR